MIENGVRQNCGLEAFTISYSATILDALKKIDSNRKGFLVVLDDAQKVYGTLTDGDVRRAFIRGMDVSSQIDTICEQKFSYINSSDSISSAIELFRKKDIYFIPILNSEGKLTNILTKGQLQVLLLHDLQADLSYDFMKLDERILDGEIYQRPWGFYKTTMLNEYFQSKILSVKPRGELSLQAHNHREEYWVVVHGDGVVQIADSLLSVQCGSTVFIPKGAKHRLTNTSETQSLIVTEVQIGEYLGEDDIIRYEDVYGRRCTGNEAKSADRET